MRHVGGSHPHFVAVSRYVREVNRQKTEDRDQEGAPARLFE